MPNHIPSPERKRDLVLIGVILSAAILWQAVRLFPSRETQDAEVSVDGSILYRLDLGKDQELDLTGFHGGTNHLVIKDRKAWISEASCPDKLCVHQGTVSLENELIVCLPNRMTVRITGKEAAAK